MTESQDNDLPREDDEGVNPDLEDRLLEASLEALGRPQQMTDLTARILNDLGEKPTKKAPKSRRKVARQRGRAQGGSSAWSYVFIGALIIFVVLGLVFGLPNKGEDGRGNPDKQPINTKQDKSDSQKTEQDATQDQPKSKQDKPKQNTPVLDEGKQDSDPKQETEKSESKKTNDSPKQATDPKENDPIDQKPKVDRPGEDKPVIDPPMNEPGTPEQTDPQLVPKPDGPTEIDDLPVLASISPFSNSVTSRSKIALEIRGNATEKWQKYTGSQELLAGTQLRARKVIDLQWRDGSLLRFQGEIQLSYQRDQAGIFIIGTQVFLDRLGSSEPLLVQMAGQTYQCAKSLACFSRKRDTVDVLCLQGEVRCQLSADSVRTLKSGEEIQVRKGKPSKTKRIRGLTRRFKILKRPSQRVLFREAFDLAPKNLTKGAVEQGQAVCRGARSSIELDFPKDRSVENGMFLRVRLQTKKIKQLTLQIWAPELQFNFRRIVAKANWSKSTWVEFPLTDFVQAVDKQSQLKVGTVIRNIQAHVEGDASSELLIDEIQLLRRVRFAK